MFNLFKKNLFKKKETNVRTARPIEPPRDLFKEVAENPPTNPESNKAHAVLLKELLVYISELVTMTEEHHKETGRMLFDAPKDILKAIAQQVWHDNQGLAHDCEYLKKDIKALKVENEMYKTFIATLEVVAPKGE